MFFIVGFRPVSPLRAKQKPPALLSSSLIKKSEDEIASNRSLITTYRNEFYPSVIGVHHGQPSLALDTP